MHICVYKLYVCVRVCVCVCVCVCTFVCVTKHLEKWTQAQSRWWNSLCLWEQGSCFFTTNSHSRCCPLSILSEPQRKPHTHQVTKSTCLVLKPQFVTRVRQVLRGLFRWGLCPGDHLQTPICFPKPLSHCRVRGVWCVWMG